MLKRIRLNFIGELLLWSAVLATVLWITLPQIYPQLQQDNMQSSAGSALVEPVVSTTAVSGFELIRIATADGLQLRSAYLLLNGVFYGDFSSGEFTLRVTDGDIIEIDGSRYSQSIEFSVTPLSAAIDSSYLVASPVTEGDTVRAALIIIR